MKSFLKIASVCALSFAATLFLLLLSIVQRLTPAMKVRMMQIAFSFTLTFSAVFALARM